MYTPKPEFERRMKMLISDYDKFLEISSKSSINSIRCNTNKISIENLKKLLEKKWQISQPFQEYPEIIIIESKLNPGELGNSIEHILGYYYVQEISSMMSVLALNPQKEELVLDLCASPGSKTTQISAMMKNTGTVIANDFDERRISILKSNIERCSCSNVIITRHDAVILCEKLKKLGIKFDKILLDLPCSGEGTLRSSPKTLEMWNLKMIKKLSRIQKKIIASAIPLLKDSGVLVYSTCTHAPEENERNIDFIIKNFNLKTEKINLPIKCREGITSWEEESFDNSVKNSCRIYPQDNNTEGFFLAKLRK